MNTVYSKVKYPALQSVNNALKDIKKGRSQWKTTEAFWMEMYVLTLSRARQVDEDALASQEIVLLSAFTKGVYRNYYLENEGLKEFLQTTEIRDYESIAGALLDLDIPQGTVAVTMENGTRVDARVGCGVIHLPGEERSVCFSLVSKGKFGTLFVSNGDDIGYIRLDNAFEKKNKALDVPVYGHMKRLVFNLLLYLECFPEAITKEAPPGVVDVLKRKHPTVMRSDSVTVRAVSEVVESGHGTRAPHFRRGHFRLLSSEFYKAKRGQLVFVRSSFVGGAAVTVLDVGEEREVIGAASL
jgi:hypothetical protein